MSNFFLGPFKTAIAYVCAAKVIFFKVSVIVPNNLRLPNSQFYPSTLCPLEVKNIWEKLGLNLLLLLLRSNN